jgi:hypothetical protein
MEKEIKLENNGFLQLFVAFVLLLAPLGLILYPVPALIPVFIFLSLFGIFWATGLFIVQPNQTKVLVFFGKYQGTVKGNGFFWLNPFYVKKKVSLRIRNLESDVIKVNDQQGIEVIEARISNLSYAPEIAGAMLRRQQATAIVAARQKIVEGAVGMVKLALNELKDQQIIELDDEKKASMVSNLLVVLCADESARPVINAGSIY